MFRCLFITLALVTTAHGFGSSVVSAQTTECSQNTPIAIPDNMPGGISDFLTISDSVTIEDTQVLVEITHSFVGDLDVIVTSPGGTTVQLHDEAGGSDNDMEVIFADSGVPNGSDDYDCACLMQPSGPGVMADFNGEEGAGDWELLVVDNAGGDTGTIANWCVTAFGQGATSPVTDLFCASVLGSGVADVTWTNAAAYDSINIYVEGDLETSLPGGTTMYSTLPRPTPQMIEVCVEGVIGGGPSPEECCNVFLDEPPGVPVMFCSSTTPAAIPDDDPAGISDAIVFPDPVGINDTEVLVQITHTFIGDLEVAVTSPGGTSVTLHGDQLGGSANDIDIEYRETGIPNGADDYDCSCEMQPSGPGMMSDFDGEDAQGSWTLAVADGAGGDTGTLDQWCVTVFTLDPMPVPPVADLECSSALGSGTATLSWTNLVAYDFINVYVNGGFETSLPGNAAGYTTNALATGQTVEVCVEGGLGGEVSPQSCCDVFLESDPGPGTQFCTQAPTVPIPDNDPAGVSDFVIFTDSVAIDDTEVLVQITHTFVGDLEIAVTSPGGTSVTLHDQGGGSDNDLDVAFRDSGIPNGSDSYDCGCSMQPSGPGMLADFDGEDAQGMWTLHIVDVAGGDVGTLDNWCVTAFGGAPGVDFIRGDCNGDGTMNPLVEALFCLDFGFLGGPPPPCPEAADADGDGALNLLADSLFILTFGFLGGPPPGAPFPGCGADPDPGGNLGCIATGCP